MTHRSRQPVVLTSFKHGSLDTYLNEWRSIRESRVISQEDTSEEEGILTDPDAIWLQNVGLGKYVSQLQRNNGIEESTEIDLETAALPHYKDVIRKRMNTLRSTIRSKQQSRRENDSGSSHSRGDVRNVFNSSGGPQSQDVAALHPSGRTYTPTGRSATPTARSATPTGRHTTPTSSPKPSPKSSPKASPGQSPHVSPRASPVPSRHIRQHSSPSIALQSTDAGSSGLDVARSSANHSPSRSRTQSGGESRLTVKSSSDISDRSVQLVRSSEVVRQRPKDLRTSSVSTASSDSPTTNAGDIKLNFRSPSHAPSNQFNGVTDLPNFMVMPDALGITYVSDLSPKDLEKVRSVALLELTVTFDDHGLPLRPRRPARHKTSPENNIFGVALSTLIQNDRQKDAAVQVPIVFEDMLSQLEKSSLEEEGLLRVPGAAGRIAALQQELEINFNPEGGNFEGVKSSDICSLLKLFIRDLPSPLMTREHLQTFASIADIEALKEQVRSLNLLILLLPDINQRVLKRLMEFLERVTQHSDTNKMDINNVAMVIAPSLFVALPSRNTFDDVLMAAKTTHVVRLLIKYHPLLWTVPGEMLRQIRFLYDAEVKRLNQRSVQKAIKQMQNQLMTDPQGSYTSKVMVEPQIIRVKAPLFTRVCMAVDISTGMTAGDIVSKLQKRSRLNKDLIRKRFSSANLLISESYRSYSMGGTESPRSVSPCDDPPGSPDDVDAGEQFLFEVGGNIGERCLSHETDMCALHSVNPSAQWIIKPRHCPDLN